MNIIYRMRIDLNSKSISQIRRLLNSKGDTETLVLERCIDTSELDFTDLCEDAKNWACDRFSLEVVKNEKRN